MKLHHFIASTNRAIPIGMLPSRPTWRARAYGFALAPALLVGAAAWPLGAAAIPWNGPSSGAGPGYAATIANGEPPITLVLSTSSVDVSEDGAEAHVTVWLANEPDQIVTVTPLADVPAAASGERQVRAAASTTALEFGPGTWSTPKSVTISAIDDDLEEPSPHDAYVTLAVIGGDAEVVTSSVVTVRVADNDTPAVLVEASDGSTAVAEGGASDSFDVRLATRPSADVVVHLEAGNQLLASSEQLTFTPDTWNVRQTARIGALQDLDVEGEHTDTVRLSVRSEDPAYSAGATLPAAQTVAISDDDVATVSVDTTGADTRVVEGGAGDDYSVRLDARPTSSVRITVTADADVVATPNVLDFSPDTWNVVQVVSVTAVDDRDDEALVENVAIRHAVGGDQHWQLVVAPQLRVAVEDNDDPVVDDQRHEAPDDGTTGETGFGGGDSSGSGDRSMRLVGPAGSTTGAAGGAAGAAMPTSGAPASGEDALTGLVAARPAPADAPARSTGGGPPAPAGEHVADRESEPAGAAARAEAPPRNAQEWYARNWKKTVPATAVGALGLGASLLALMSDPLQAGRRRPW